MADYILFDFDGTVYDTVEGITRSVQYALSLRGIEAELRELRCFAGPPLVEMFMEKYGFDEPTARQVTTDFRVRYNPVGVYESRPFDGIRELLLALRAMGKRTAVATSKPQRLANELLERSGLLELFDLVCGAGDQGEGNAKWQVVQRAMDGLGAEKEKTVLIGDTKYDVAGAHRCGIPCIGVGFGYGTEEEMAEAGVDAMAADCAELLALLSE